MTAAHAPFWRKPDGVQRMMLLVLLALLPVITATGWALGSGVLLNIVVASAACLLLEWLALVIRGKPAGIFLTDGSALLTAILLALALPPLIPWWVIVTGCLFAIVFAKHLYGGVGYNIFNPAMVGYVVVFISFPLHVAMWPTPGETASLADAAHYLMFGELPAGATIDALSSATPLDLVKTQLKQMYTIPEIMDAHALGGQRSGWFWINLAALAGGLALLRMKVIRWHIPAATLGTLAALHTVFFLADAETHIPPLLALFSGGTMLAAFFIATDPVSAPSSDRGKLYYGAGIGLLCFALRQWGAHPDGIAFAVLFMNMATPLIDRYTVPRVYGHDPSRNS